MAVGPLSHRVVRSQDHRVDETALCIEEHANMRVETGSCEIGQKMKVKAQ